MNGERDLDLGAALLQLDVPPHGPDFMPGLLARLEQDATGRVRRPWPRPFLLAVAAAAIATTVFAVSTLLPERNPTIFRPRVATAAEVRTRVAQALATARTLQGELSFECAVPYAECMPPESGQGTTTLRWTVTATATGNERITALDGLDDLALDANSRTARDLITRDRPRPQASEYANLPTGPPDYSSRSPLRREFGSLVRAFLDTTADAPVTTATVDGRPVWQVSIPVQINKLAGPGSSGDRLDVVVDQQTGFPVRVTESLAGRALLDARLSKLSIDTPVTPSTFALTFPPGAAPFRQDFGFQRTTVDQASAVVGYRPILPSNLPSGFTLADLTVARQSQPTGVEGMNPPGRNVVSAVYRRGFDRIVVTTRLTGADPSVWEDPVATGEGIRDEPQPVTISAGALAGARANLVLTPRGVPHVWAINSRFVVTVAGDATGAELTRIVQSFG